MSPCPDAELLSRLIDGELEEERVPALHEHLGECSACIDRLEDMVTIETRARRVLAGGWSGTWSGWGQLGFVAALILLAFLVAVFGMFASLSCDSPARAGNPAGALTTPARAPVSGSSGDRLSRGRP